LKEKKPNPAKLRNQETMLALKKHEAASPPTDPIAPSNGKSKRNVI